MIPTISIAEALLIKLFKQFNLTEISLTTKEIENFLDADRVVVHSLLVEPSDKFEYKITLQEV